MYNIKKKESKTPVKLFLKTSNNKSKKKSNNNNNNNKNKISHLDNSKNRAIHEAKLKEMKLLEKELNDIENQNELLSKEKDTLKDKRKNISEKYNIINTEAEKEQKELSDLQKTNLIKNKVYLELLNLRIQQQVINSISSMLNLDFNTNNNTNNNNTNDNTNSNNTDNNNISDLFNRLNLLLHLSRLRRANTEEGDDTSPLIQNQNNNNNNDNNEEGPPLSFNQMQNLPSFNYNINNNTNEKCIICGMLFSINDVAVKLRCNHTFHKNCLINRLISKRSSKCPTCKFSII